ncbi:hypothetical protein EI94DRAFT_1708109 [Lactarius quietus]|nr:hypothetical protein EI94DRAFT_1708109 [Lactarius quietus]
MKGTRVAKEAKIGRQLGHAGPGGNGQVCMTVDVAEWFQDVSSDGEMSWRRGDGNKWTYNNYELDGNYAENGARVRMGMAMDDERAGKDGVSASTMPSLKRISGEEGPIATGEMCMSSSLAAHAGALVTMAIIGLTGTVFGVNAVVTLALDTCIGRARDR